MIALPCNILKKNNFFKRITNKASFEHIFNADGAVNEKVILNNKGSKIFLERHLNVCPGYYNSLEPNHTPVNSYGDNYVSITVVFDNDVHYETYISDNLISQIQEISDMSGIEFTMFNNTFYYWDSKDGSNTWNKEVNLTIKVEESELVFEDSYCNFSVSKNNLLRIFSKL